MSPTRFRECLAILELSQRGLAPLLRCSERLPRAWAAGSEPIPPAVAAWLEEAKINPGGGGDDGRRRTAAR